MRLTRRTAEAESYKQSRNKATTVVATVEELRPAARRELHRRASVVVTSCGLLQ